MEAKEPSLLLYDMYNLNNEKLDFRGQSMKRVSYKTSMLEDGQKVQWREEDLKEANVTLTTVNSATEFVVDASDMQVGESLYNQTTGTTVLIINVVGSTITLEAPGDTAATAGDILVRISFAKEYGVDSSFAAKRNDLVPYFNYIQYIESSFESNSVNNNKTRLFIETAEDYLARQFTDSSRKIVKTMAQSFYFGIRALATSTGGNTIYAAGGLEYYIPASAKVNVQGADDESTKKNIRDQLTAAYQSGLSNIWGNNKLLAFCTTKWMDEIDRLYEDKLIYNDKLKGIDIEITTYSVGGKKLNMIESNILNETVGDLAVTYLVPIDYAFLYNIPNLAANADGKTLNKVGRGVVYKKPQVTIEKSDIALATTFSYMFGGVTSGAYRKLYFA